MQTPVLLGALVAQTSILSSLSTAGLPSSANLSGFAPTVDKVLRLLFPTAPRSITADNTIRVASPTAQDSTDVGAAFADVLNHPDNSELIYNLNNFLLNQGLVTTYWYFFCDRSEGPISTGAWCSLKFESGIWTSLVTTQLCNDLKDSSYWSLSVSTSEQYYTPPMTIYPWQAGFCITGFGQDANDTLYDNLNLIILAITSDLMTKVPFTAQPTTFIFNGMVLVAGNTDPASMTVVLNNDPNATIAAQAILSQLGASSMIIRLSAVIATGPLLTSEIFLLFDTTGLFTVSQTNPMQDGAGLYVNLLPS